MSQPQDDPVRDRFAILAGLRAGGIALMAVGLWMWLGGSLGGRYGFGTVLFVVGAIGGLAAPALLARRWRTRR
jgi:hypothetical protein